MYYLIGYAICLTFTVGLLAWVLILRTQFSPTLKKVASAIVALGTLGVSILFMSFIPFKWINLVFYAGIAVGYAAVVAGIYWLVHFIYQRVLKARGIDEDFDEEENSSMEELPSKKAVQPKRKKEKETVLSLPKKEKNKPNKTQPAKQATPKTVAKAPAPKKEKVAPKSAPKKATPKKVAEPVKKAPLKKETKPKATAKPKVEQQPPVIGKGYIRPVEEKTTKQPIPGPSAAEEARMARSKAQKPAPIKKRENPFKK